MQDKRDNGLVMIIEKMVQFEIEHDGDFCGVWGKVLKGKGPPWYEGHEVGRCLECLSSKPLPGGR